MIHKLANLIRGAPIKMPRVGSSFRLWPVGNLATNPRKSKQEQLAAYAGYVYNNARIIAQDEAAAVWQWWNQKGTRDEWEVLAESEVAPLLRLLTSKPNSEMRFRQFLYLRSLHKSLTGESYIHLITTRGGRLVGFELLYPHWVKDAKLDDDGRLEGWHLQVPGRAPQVLSKEDVITDFLPHPAEPYQGMSPVEAFAISYDLDLYARAYGAALLKNRAFPDLLLTTEQELDADQSEFLRKRWKEKYQVKAGEVAVLGKGAKAQLLGLTLKDLAFLELSNLSKGQIDEAMGVPALKRGGGDATNYAVAVQQENTYNENTLLPRLRATGELVNQEIIPRTNLDKPPYFEHVSPVKADREFEQKRALTSLKAGSITVNQYLEATNQPPQGEDGDVFLVPANVTIRDNLKPDERTTGDLDRQLQQERKARQSLELEKLERKYYQILRAAFAGWQKTAKQEDLECFIDLKDMKRLGLNQDQLVMYQSESSQDYYERLKSKTAKEIAKSKAVLEMALKGFHGR